MKKIIHQFSIIAIILLLGACSNDEIFEKNDNNPAPGKRRTLSITATMPGDKSDGPNTRVDLEQLGDKSIELTWEKTDELQLAFVQGETKIKGIATMMSVSDDGKKAQFDMLIPDEITDGVFDLYGVYGGGGLDKTDPTLAKLPENAGDAGSLTDIQTRKDVMLHFVSKDISIANPKISAVFKHLGSLFSITIKNTGSTSLDNLTEARLVGVGENKKWAYNIGAGGSSYDLVSGEFQNMEGAGNYISFKVDESTVISEETITFWCWYPPLPEKVWPELKLELTTTNTLISINTKPERTEPTEAGKSFNFFAVWDGSQLGFSDIDFNPSVGGPGVYHVETMGTLGALLGDDKANISAMKLTGEINDVDFEVMKGKMPKLRYLDLSDVTCEYDRIPPRAFGGDWVSNTHISTIILPKSITEIYTDAFYGCTGLTGTLTLPDGLTSIGYGAFQGCKNLVGTLIIPNGIDKIEGSVFSGCSGLTGLTIPNELREIKSHAFYNCSNITGTIIFPVSIYNIGESGFEGCSNITAFRFPPFYDFEYTPNMLPSGVTVEVQSSALARYKVADGWKDHPIVAYDVTSFFVETMGSLGALIGDDKTTISAMKLTGQINKADFVSCKCR